MNIVLFGLTGMGNAVLRTLISIGIKPVLLVTRQESGVYPYYSERQLSDEALQLGIPVLFGEEGEQEVIHLKPDVIFSATYHRRIPLETITAAKQAFNLHPSLLPRYAGKNPFYAVLINNELVTGISIHRLTEKFDSGEVVFQQTYDIRSDETQGSLRQALATSADKAIRIFFDRLSSGDELGRIEINSPPGLLLEPTGEMQRIIDLRKPAELISRQVRALQPWPCAILQEIACSVSGIISIDRNVSSIALPDRLLFADAKTAKVRVADAEMTFSIERSNIEGKL